MLQTCLIGELRDLVDQVLDKWSLSILAVLYDGPLRFSVLRRELPDITQKSLAHTLKRLERNGIVHREVLTTRPLAVQYGITPLGHSLEEALEALAGWAGDHIDEVERARATFSTRADSLPVG